MTYVCDLFGHHECEMELYVQIVVSEITDPPNFKLCAASLS